MNHESDGERAVCAALKNLNIKYEQEKVIDFLEKDTKKYRVADFFLPKYNLYIEYLGGWDKKNPEHRAMERRRYGHKKYVYRKNAVRCIWIYPNQLNYVSSVIMNSIESFQKKKKEVSILSDNSRLSKVIIAIILVIFGTLIFLIEIEFFVVTLLFYGIAVWLLR